MLGPIFDIERLACGGGDATIVVVTLLVLLFGFGSLTPGAEVTVAVFTIEPVAVATTVPVTM